jgi:hypothetical protein
MAWLELKLGVAIVMLILVMFSMMGLRKKLESGTALIQQVLI